MDKPIRHEVCEGQWTYTASTHLNMIILVIALLMNLPFSQMTWSEKQKHRLIGAGLPHRDQLTNEYPLVRMHPPE